MKNLPLVNFHFIVEWGGTKLGFSEVSGLIVEQEVLEYREGASPTYSTVKIPGKKKYSNIILKRGAFQEDNEFYDWFNTIQLSSVERRDITIRLLNEDHEPTVVWKIKNAWPVAVRSAELNATKSDILFEILEIAHEGFSVHRG